MRCFFALPLPAGARPALAGVQALLAEAARGCRWTPPGTLHLTLSFLGELCPEEVETARAILLRLSPPARPPALAFDRLDWFPDRRRPRVLVALGALRPAAAGAVAGPDGLAELQLRLEAGLRAEGLISGQSLPFRPHLSLARLGGDSRRPAIPAALLSEAGALLAASGSWGFERLVLFESRLGRGGALHLPLAELGFGKSGLGPAGSASGAD